MRLIIFFCVSSIFFCVECTAQAPLGITKSNFVIGECLSFESNILKEERKVNIYLPASYDENKEQKYPVIYLLDGSSDEDFIHISGLVQFASFSWIQIIPETIVVGISNIDRKRDFTHPTTIAKDSIDFPTTGQSKIFIEFLKAELLPMINNNYKVDTTATIIGQSLGGLLATEILLTDPEIFDNYIIISPSLWWDAGSVLENTFSGNHKSIYIGVGKEGDVMEGTAMELYTKLLREKTETEELFFKFFENQDHGDVLHLAAYDALEKLFNKSNN